MGAGYERLLGELIMIQDTGQRRVGMLPKAHEEFMACDERWRKKLERHFRNYGVPGTSMPHEHFNSEGRYPTGGPQSRNVQVCAFKAFQHRVYGVVMAVRSFETFVGLKVVEDKKRNRADQELLARVAKSFAPYVD